MVRHTTFGGRNNRSVKTIDGLEGTAVSSKFIEAAKAASDAFRRAGVRHTLVGGLAVGVHGFPRHTKDVDFLVGEEAFHRHGLLVTPKSGLPIRHGDVDIDWVSLEGEDRRILDRFLEVPAEGHVPVIPAGPLVYMKLLAGRRRDAGDDDEALDFMAKNATAAMADELNDIMKDVEG